MRAASSAIDAGAGHGWMHSTVRWPARVAPAGSSVTDPDLTHQTFVDRRRRLYFRHITNGEFEVIACPRLVHEVREALPRPRIASRYGIAASEVDDLARRIRERRSGHGTRLLPQGPYCRNPRTTTWSPSPLRMKRMRWFAETVTSTASQYLVSGSSTRRTD